MEYNREESIENLPTRRFDFYLKKYKILIEYDGEQHFKFVKQFHDTEEGFVKSQEIDVVKTVGALKAGYKLIRLDHLLKTKKSIELILLHAIETMKSSNHQLYLSSDVSYDSLLRKVRAEIPNLTCFVRHDDNPKSSIARSKLINNYSMVLIHNDELKYLRQILSKESVTLLEVSSYSSRLTPTELSEHSDLLRKEINDMFVHNKSSNDEHKSDVVTDIDENRRKTIELNMCTCGSVSYNGVPDVRLSYMCKDNGGMPMYDRDEEKIWCESCISKYYDGNDEKSWCDCNRLCDKCSDNFLDVIEQNSIDNSNRDPFTRVDWFISEHYVLSESKSASARELESAYKAWCKKRNYSILPSEALSNYILVRYKDKVNKTTEYLGNNKVSYYIGLMKK